jgi:ubiquinone/menaquinone biosynthesis C-methylase UbiE
MSTEYARFTEDIPFAYDRGLGPVLFHDYAEHTARQVARFGPQRVLETCAGTGIVTRHLRDVLPATTAIVATDLNVSMLDVAQTKFHPGDAVEFQSADAMELPFPDRSFDMLVCQFGVMFFPDKAKAYHEAYRVLTPGGHYVFSVWDGSVRGAPLATDDVMRKLFPVDPPQFYGVTANYNRIDPIKEAITEAGFTGLRVEVVTRDTEVSDVTGFAHALVCGNPLIDMIRGRGSVRADDAVKAIAETLMREFGSPLRWRRQAIVFEVTRE